MAKKLKETIRLKQNKHTHNKELEYNPSFYRSNEKKVELSLRETERECRHELEKFLGCRSNCWLRALSEKRLGCNFFVSIDNFI